jgi:hypothetical protein
MRRFACYAVVIGSAVFALLRFALPSTGEIHGDDVFKDLAHLWVGGLFGAALALTLTPPPEIDYPANARASAIREARRSFWITLLWSLTFAMTVLEAVAFFLTRPGGVR